MFQVMISLIMMLLQTRTNRLSGNFVDMGHLFSVVLFSHAVFLFFIGEIPSLREVCCVCICFVSNILYSLCC